jgi:hypothetical protein
MLPQSTDRAVTDRTPTKPEGRILPFRPRGALFARNIPPSVPDLEKYEVPDLEKYERTPDEPDDFRHRMIMNGLGLGVTIVLIAGGLWIADVMAQIRKNQDCVLTGRLGCNHLNETARAR